MKALVFMCCFVTPVKATTWYVDSSAAGADNGTSWVNAWTALSQINGVAPGDTVYISGGPSGQTRNYSVPLPWVPISGSSGSRVTYRIGQDSLHNGTAAFSCSAQFIQGVVHDMTMIGDAGDGKQHFLFSALGNTPFSVSGCSNVRFAYFNCPASTNAAHGMVYINGGSGFELDHCYYYKHTMPGEDNIAFLHTTVQAWDDCKIHDNEFHAPHSTTQEGFGDDFCNSNNMNGVSFYNNKYISYGVSNYLTGQHQDACQPLAGSYIKYYNNYLENITNYAFYGDAYYGNFSHVWVYNNIAVLSDPIVQGFAGPGGIIIGVDGGSQGATFTDIVIANNLLDGYGQHQGISLDNVTSHPGRFTSCLIANNVSINGGSIITTGNTTTTVVNNVLLAVSAGPGNFVGYAANGTNNNYHLLKTSSLIGKGINLSNDFSSDKDGKLRAPTGAWDIGPYVYNALNAPPPPSKLRVVQ
jgi:hypothetical protein